MQFTGYSRATRNARSFAPVCASQNAILPCMNPPAIKRPSGLYAMQFKPFLVVRIAPSSIPVSTSQTRIVQSSALAIRRPSGLQTKHFTGPPSPRRAANSAPLSARQMRIAPSAEPLTIRFPSRLNTIDLTDVSCPQKTARKGDPRWIGGDGNIVVGIYGRAGACFNSRPPRRPAPTIRGKAPPILAACCVPVSRFACRRGRSSAPPAGAYWLTSMSFASCDS
jgi:hypothetical protein